MKTPKRTAPAVAVLALFAASAAVAQDVQKDLVARIDALKPELLELSEWLCKNPEIGHNEFKAAEKVTGFLKKHRWSVDMGLAKLPDEWGPVLEKVFKVQSLPTAFKAAYPGLQSGGPTIGFLVEHDALRGAGGKAFHGCRHNMQGPAGIGAATALAEYMKKNRIPGRLMVFGTRPRGSRPP